jgi:hypothetical protein
VAGTIRAEAADSFYRRRLVSEPLWSPEDDPVQVGLIGGPVWWAARRDSISLKRYVERMKQQTHMSQSPAGPVPKSYWLGASEAYLALSRGDSAVAIARLTALPDSTGPVWFERLTLSRLLAATGRDSAALAVLDGEFPFPGPTGSHGIWALERARLAEKLGESGKARRWYGYVVALWQNADQELQPLVAEAREALVRLTAESKT